MEVSGQLLIPFILPPGVRARVHHIGGWVDPRGSLNIMGKIIESNLGYPARTQRLS
jgi:hypothetical protein